MSKKVAITLGCPAGIGPEVIIKALNQFKEDLSNILIIGDKTVLQNTASKLGLPFPNVEVLSLSELDIEPGSPTLEGYKAMASYIEKAIELAKKGEVGAIVTAPISKEGLSKIGIPYKGHTEWLAERLGVKDYVMAFYANDLIVSLVTTHLPLKDVPPAISEEKIIRVCCLSAEFLQKLGKKNYSIAVCGLNPHAGEGGLLGTEEKEIIEKAILKCKEQGLLVQGPFPADTVFYWALKGRFDLVVAMYHDQGLAPFKLLHFEDGVNITLGLPIVRTSPAHGTAYDIAGKGIADPKSFLSALKLACKLLS